VIRPGTAPAASLPAALARVLAAEFPGYSFGPARTWRGQAVQAVRRDRDAAGVYAVITSDPDEMRRVLRGTGAAR
jgi:hypothetical protein